MRQIYRKKIWALIILVGVAMGTLLLNLMMGIQGTALKEQVEQFHRLIQNQAGSSIGLFLRICFYRIGTALILLYCTRFMQNYYIFYPVVFVLSLSFGYTLALLSYQYGAKGLIYMFGYLCPHYFIYIPLFAVVLREAGFQMDQIFAPNKRRTALIFLLIFIGCGVEAYVNPPFLKFVLKNFL